MEKENKLQLKSEKTEMQKITEKGNISLQKKEKKTEKYVTSPQKIEKENSKNNKLKPIKVKRNIKDILIKTDPSHLISNYTGKFVSIFPTVVPNNCLNEQIKENNINEICEHTGVIDDTLLTEHENQLLKELTELLNNKNLSDEMKNNMRSIFIEVQDFYLEIKREIQLHFPSTENLLKLYSSDYCNKEDKKDIWKRFCFYKLLKEQLNDLHLSTISSYRLKCLKSIYNWYHKHKRLLFNENIKERNFITNIEEKKECVKDICEEEEGKHIDKKESADFDKILNDCIFEKKNKTQEDETNTFLLLDKKNDVICNETDFDMQDYIHINDFMNSVKENEKGELTNMDIYNNEIKKHKIEVEEKGETIENAFKNDKTEEKHVDAQLNHLDEQSNDFFQMPIDTQKIKELEEEIKRQKLLIKEKENEIINSPIGLKFKDIFGNFQDIDLNN